MDLNSCENMKPSFEQVDVNRQNWSLTNISLVKYIVCSKLSRRKPA